MSLQEHVSLKALNTFGIEAQARYYSLINDIPTLQQLLLRPDLQDLPHLTLGSGSNILFIQDFPGWVIHLSIASIEKIDQDPSSVCLKIGAGLDWHALVTYCIENGYAGIENLSLIPGTVGAAPIQNISAYGAELSEVFESLEAIEVSTGATKTFYKSDCAFGYRESVFKNELQGQYVISYVTLRLQKVPTFKTEYTGIKEALAAMNVEKLSLQAISDAIIRIRQSKLPNPSKAGNAGSFFKNPVLSKSFFEELQPEYPNMPYFDSPEDQVKIPAAWLIEESGWKGYREGPVGVHPNHALVLVNYGGATGQAVYQLAQKIQQSVQDKFGITLVPEVNII
jgi:UDP-N-acetylmuramate dehydrogenase